MAEGTLLLQQALPARTGFVRRLRFLAPGVDPMVQAAAALWQEGRRRFVLRGEAWQVDAVTRGLRLAVPALEIITGAAPVLARQDTAYLYPGLVGDALADALMAHVDEPSAAVLAPRGERHFSRLPLFLIAIPKAGTHLLYELAQALGYGAGMICPDYPAGGKWYYLEYSNAHTRAADFLVDTTRHRPFGNKHHPFFRAPALFIYRDPRDILVSEANWFHLGRNSPLAGYLDELSFEERLARLVDDPWLLGSIRDRVGAFIPWLSFPNVIPISFEELVGADGGGSDEAQLDLIWSIQLKLQIDGTPEEIARQLFNLDSPTFTEGRIGAWDRHTTPEARERFVCLPTDFLRCYGYARDKRDGAAALPARTAEFRRRPLRFAQAECDDTPILIESGYLDHNIVQLGRHFYGVPQSTGPVRLERLGRDKIRGILRARSLDKAKAAVLRRWLLTGSLLERLRYALKPMR